MSDIKLQPQNIDAEKAVIGACLLDKDAVIKVAEFLVPEHFYDEKHRLIFEAIIELYEDRDPVDIVTIPDKLKKNDALKKIGGVAYITDLLNQTPSASNVESHGKLVRDAYIRRRLIQVSADIANMGFDEGDNVEDVLDKAEQKLFGISQHSLKGEFVSLKTALEESFDLLDEIGRAHV